MSHGHRELAPLSRWLALSRMSRSARSKGEAREESPCAATGADHQPTPANRQQKGPRHAQRLGLTTNPPPPTPTQKDPAKPNDPGRPPTHPRQPPAERTTPCAPTGADHQPTPANRQQKGPRHAQRLGLTTNPPPPTAQGKSAALRGRRGVQTKN